MDCSDIYNVGLRRKDNAFIFISVLVHIAVYYGVTHKRVKPPEPPRVEVEYLEPVVAVKKLPKKPLPKLQQVVEQDKQQNHEEDKETKYLSAFTQKVEKETRAKSNGQFQNGGEKLQDLSKTFAVEKGGEMPKPSESNTPRSQTDDYLDDLEAGMNTVVNTREFAYYAYFNRIKESLRLQWEPDLRSKMTIIRRKEREVASVEPTEKAAQLLVTLDRHGGLMRVEVIKSSGNHVLDDLALNAFKKAAPFNNPPAGIIETDGTIKIRWDFILAI